MPRWCQNIRQYATIVYSEVLIRENDFIRKRELLCVFLCPSRLLACTMILHQRLGLACIVVSFVNLGQDFGDIALHQQVYICIRT